MWSPTSLDELNDMLRKSIAEMRTAEQRLWGLVRIHPQKWALSPWGDEGGGFWAVGIIGGLVIWYNDIECGFNISRYTEYGRISDYSCNQDDGSVQPVIWDLLHEIETGQTPPGAFGRPQPPPT